VELDEAVVGRGLETRGRVEKAAKGKTERAELVVCHLSYGSGESDEKNDGGGGGGGRETGERVTHKTIDRVRAGLSPRGISG
jgi:hypothetical protein